MQTLNLPSYDFITRQMEGKQQVYDPLRQRYVRLTPEEWVRQHFAQFLIRERGVPPGLVTVEHAFTYQGMPQRADLLIHDRTAAPLLLVECKAPEQAISQRTFDQAARYNHVLRAPYLIVTNGMEHYCCSVDFQSGNVSFLKSLPDYDVLVAD